MHQHGQGFFFVKLPLTDHEIILLNPPRRLTGLFFGLLPQGEREERSDEQSSNSHEITHVPSLRYK